LAKIDQNGTTLGEMRSEQAELRAAVKSNTEAVQANTEAVGKLIKVIELRIGQDPNGQPPQN